MLARPDLWLPEQCSEEIRKSLRSISMRDSVLLPTGIASRRMAGNGISTVMMKGIFEELVEGHQLPKRESRNICGGETGSVSVVLAH